MSRTDRHVPPKYLPEVETVTSHGHVYVNMPTEWWETEGRKHFNEMRKIRYEYMRHTPKWSRIMNRAKRRRDIARDIREQMGD